MSSELNKLATSSEEARAIFDNFSKRLRVHKNKALDINRLFHYFTSVKGRKFSRSKFEEVFTELERLGYGIVGKTMYGNIKEFLPDTHIKAIGMEAKPVLEEIKIPIAPQERVIVLFTLKGLKCKAEVPKDAIEEFQDLVSR